MITRTITVDSREQTPLPFPPMLKWFPRRTRKPELVKLVTKVDKMPEGDYCIEGFADTCLIETKRSARELCDNIIGCDFKRADSAFTRLSDATSFPLLLCEFSQSDLLSEEDGTDDGHPGRVADAVSWAVAKYGLNLWFAGPRSGIQARRKTAECAARFMLAVVDFYHPNFVRSDQED